MSDLSSSLPIRTEARGDVQVKIVDDTNPAQGLSVDADGKIASKLSDGAGNEVTSQASGAQRALDVGINVAGVQIDPRDIRALTNADVVTVEQTTHDSLNANVTIQVGDVDVSNANPVPISDAGGSITIDAVDLDIRDLSALQDNVAISDGTNTLAVAADGSIKVVVQEDVGTEVVNYDTTSAVAGGASDNHDYVVTNGGKLFQVLATGSGKLKAEVQIETGSATNVFNTVAVAFNSTATPNMELMLAKYATIPVGARVRVIRTNRENQAQDVYSTIILIANL